MLDLSTIFASFPVLETERCLLREITLDNLDDLFRLLSNPDVSRYLGRHPLTSLDEVIKRIHVCQTTFQEHTGVHWAITSREQGQVIGTCVLWKIDTVHCRGELGYILTPEWWGQGIIPEVSSAIMSFGFTQMGLHSIEAHIDPANTGSRRVLEKLGFVQEGHFHENFYNPVTETFVDTAVFSLLKSAWMSRKDA